MNHNFLPFEITELLPKENPYNSCEEFCWADADGQGYQIQSYDHYGTGDKDLCGNFWYERDAWGVFDCLTYLEEQGYVIEVLRFNYNKTLNEWRCMIVNLSTENYYDTETIHNSRIEAYIAGIEHCLNLIKNEQRN